MTIELPAKVELALASEAARLGTSAQSLAVHLIESHLPIDTPAPVPPSGTSMDERWKEHFDSLPPASTKERPEWLRADNVSEALNQILLQQRREGRL